MEQSTKTTLELPKIVKQIAPTHNGLQSHALSRYAIGYVLRGVKYIYNGDTRREVARGDLFYLGIGMHYTEELPEGGQPYEEIVFYYTPAELQRLMLHLNITYGLDITNDHVCDQCANQAYVVMPGWNAVRSFFANTSNYIHDELFRHNEAAENLKMTELIYLIASHGDSCIKNKLLGNVDAAKENFEQIVHAHIFRDISIKTLSDLCNRSLTSFKKEFRRIFNMPPHKWFIRQRLMRARLLLISTNKSISEIGVACAFPNTSHFIKLFKKEFAITPATYRNRHAAARMLSAAQAAAQPAAEEKKAAV